MTYNNERPHHSLGLLTPLAGSMPLVRRMMGVKPLVLTEVGVEIPPSQDTGHDAIANPGYAMRMS